MADEFPLFPNSLSWSTSHDDSSTLFKRLHRSGQTRTQQSTRPSLPVSVNQRWLWNHQQRYRRIRKEEEHIQPTFSTADWVFHWPQGSCVLPQDLEAEDDKLIFRWKCEECHGESHSVGLFRYPPYSFDQQLVATWRVYSPLPYLQVWNVNVVPPWANRGVQVKMEGKSRSGGWLHKGVQQRVSGRV